MSLRNLELRAEIEAAKAVKCPLHGERFTRLAPTIYRAMKIPQHLDPAWRKWRSPQYIKAMEASFPPDRWPRRRSLNRMAGVRFVLKDGTEIYRLPPPEPVYDYISGELAGFVEGYPPKFRAISAVAAAIGEKPL